MRPLPNAATPTPLRFHGGGLWAWGLAHIHDGETTILVEYDLGVSPEGITDAAAVAYGIRFVPYRHCLDCGHEVAKWEYLMLTREQWARTGAGGGFLCLGCMDARVGPLTPAHFNPNVPVNRAFLAGMWMGARYGWQVGRLEGLRTAAQQAVAAQQDRLVELGREMAAQAAALAESVRERAHDWKRGS
jgi:hypothetical protein